MSPGQGTDYQPLSRKFSFGAAGWSIGVNFFFFVFCLFRGPVRTAAAGLSHSSWQGQGSNPYPPDTSRVR